MNTSKPHTRCRVASTTRVEAMVQTPSLLAQLLPPRVINLAELTRSIVADRNLRRRVTEAASREYGWSTARVEDAIVLLGQQRLCALVDDAEMLKGEYK